MYGGVRGAPRQLNGWRGRLLDCVVVLFSGRLSALARTYSFAIFGLCVGWCELQMCMAFSVGFSFYS
jgi:hypothetical protein